MRDRLIRLINHCTSCEECRDEDIADFLLANGVIVPPFKVGTHVYVLRSKTSNGKNLYLREEHIDHYRIFGERAYMCFFSDRTSVPNYLWGKTVFLIREEAEKALAEREGK
jgi:hypothetical protein